MKKIDTTYRKKFTLLKLYKDDLLKIEKIYSENVEDYRISLGDYELEEINEIEKIDDEIVKSFSIESFKPHIRLYLTESSAEIIIDDEKNTIQIGVLHRIDEVLNNRKNTIYNVFFRWIFIYLSPVYLYIIFNPPNIENTLLKGILGGLFILLPWLYLLLTYIYEHTNYCRIYLTEKKSTPGFFKRNKDNLVILIIGTMFGGLITFLLTKYFSK